MRISAWSSDVCSSDLANIYHQGRPLLQVFLIGQPEFRRKLASQGLEQLRQRIVAIHHLTPLNEVETREYILFRLTTAGWNSDPSIAEDCFPLIHREARGVPRLINNLCDRLLWHAFIEEKHAVGPDDLRLVIDDMRLDARGLSLDGGRSEEHTSELQSLMRISYAVFCLKKKTTKYER